MFREFRLLTQKLIGAASDKVAALERAGAVVTDSPAKIGSEMLKVQMLVYVVLETPTHTFFRQCKLLALHR